MKYIILGSSGRLAREFIQYLQSQGLEYSKYSSKDTLSWENLTFDIKEPFVIYDFMCSLRPSSEENYTAIKLEKELRNSVYDLNLCFLVRYVFISTAGELYKAMGSIKHITQIRKNKDLSPYAKHKLDVEHELRIKFQNKVLIYRISNIYGGTFRSKELGVVDNWIYSRKCSLLPQLTTTIDTYRNYVSVNYVIQRLLNIENSFTLDLIVSEDYYFLSEIYEFIFSSLITFNSKEDTFLFDFGHQRESQKLLEHIKKELL